MNKQKSFQSSTESSSSGPIKSFAKTNLIERGIDTLEGNADKIKAFVHEGVKQLDSRIDNWVDVAVSTLKSAYGRIEDSIDQSLSSSDESSASSDEYSNQYSSNGSAPTKSSKSNGFDVSQGSQISGRKQDTKVSTKH